MRGRKITSLTALLSFIALITTSVVLFIVPQGRVAYWADWHLWGLDKTEWGNIHINLGCLFLISIGLHTYYNWKLILTYLKKSRKMRLFTPEFNAALALTALFILGTYWEAPPFRWVLAANETVKSTAVAKFGEPPYGHAELSTLRGFAKRTGLELPASLARLEAAGIAFESDAQTLADIARANRLSPRQVYLAMQPPPAGTPGTQTPMPPSPPPGTGNRELADICREYGIELAPTIQKLEQMGLTLRAEDSLKDNATANGVSPFDLYDKIRSIAESE
jgi:hypothetical protein